MTTEMHPFERVLSVSTEDIELELRGITEIVWGRLLAQPKKIAWK